MAGKSLRAFCRGDHMPEDKLTVCDQILDRAGKKERRPWGYYLESG